MLPDTLAGTVYELELYLDSGVADGTPLRDRLASFRDNVNDLRAELAGLIEAPALPNPRTIFQYRYQLILEEARARLSDDDYKAFHQYAAGALMDSSPGWQNWLDF